MGTSHDFKNKIRVNVKKVVDLWLDEAITTEEMQTITGRLKSEVQE